MRGAAGRNARYGYEASDQRQLRRSDGNDNREELEGGWICGGGLRELGEVK